MGNLGRGWVAAIGVVVGIVLGYAAGTSSDSETPPAAPSLLAAADSDPEPDLAIPEETAEAAPTGAPTEAEAAGSGTLKPSNFRIDVRVLKSSCFGSAGGLLTYRIDPVLVGTSAVPADGTEVIYQVNGDEGGPIINTFTITGGVASFDKEENASTRSCNGKLTARATEVLEPGV